MPQQYLLTVTGSDLPQDNVLLQTAKFPQNANYTDVKPAKLHRQSVPKINMTTCQIQLN